MIDTPSILRTSAQRTATIHLLIPGRDMPTHMDPAIKEIIKVLSDQGITPAGPMFSYHHRRPSDTFDLEIGFPVTKAIKPTGRVVNGSLPAEKVARSVYKGPYDGLARAWGELQGWVRERKLAETGHFWERYLDNPEKVPDPNAYRTELNWVIG